MSKLNEFYNGCRTYRRFLQDPLPEEALREILENVRIANSGINGQAVKVYAVVSPEKVAGMQGMVKWAGALPPEIGYPKPGEQPVAFMVLTRPAQAYGFIDVDIGIIAHVITTTAWAYGFGSCMMGNVNIKKVAELLSIPDSEVVRLAIPLGKPAHKSTIVDVPESGRLAYYVDDNRDYYVPKKKVEEISSIL